MADIKTFEFKCTCCDEIHKGLPSFGSDAPNYYFSIPEDEIKDRVLLTSDKCIVDNQYFFVRGCLELPIIGYDDVFTFGSWVSLSMDNFEKFESLFEEKQRSHNDPMFGWFSTWIYSLYEGSENIKSRIHLRDNGIRPYIELEPTEHPLSIAQTKGITPEQVIKIYEYYVHGKK